jgi:signal transduction histidine kinase
VGDVAGMDMIAIPMDAVNASLVSEARTNLIATAAWLVLLFASIFVAFRLIVTRRLKAITKHFQMEAAQESGEVDPVPESGKDEISVLAHSFNSLAHRLRALHGSLEQQVQDRTEKLSMTNEDLRNEVESRKKAEEALRQEQRLLKRSLRTHDHERQMIAYEIHDGLAQQLAGAIMSFQTFDQLRDGQPEEASRKCEATMEMLRQSLAEARRLINGVRPPLLDEEGVIVAVQNLLAEHKNAGGSEVELHHSPGFGRFEPVLENAIYRIVQESLTNAQHHSGSTKIRACLEREGDHVQIEVQDWGVGFDVNQKKDKAMGLRGIRERAKLLGGQAEIESELGKGTRIVVDLPLEPPEDDADDSDS